MKTLSSTVAGLMIFAASGFAAPGGGTGMAVGTAAAVGGGGRAASTAPAAHVSGSSVGGNHAALGSSGNTSRSASPGTFGGAGATSRSPGFAASQGAAVRVLPTMPTVHNAWSDPVNPRVGGARANYASTGQNLYPGTYGYNPANRPASNHFRRDPVRYGGGRSYHRYYYNNFPYPVYYPYLYGGIGYGGAVGDYAGLTADTDVADLGAPDFTTAPNNYYSYVVPAQDAPNTSQSAAAPQQPLPDAPVVGPQSPSSAAKSPTTQQGPDSLVEAVQDELAERGYFAGKSDAIYGDATKEAIRRFQTNQGLPATGRINEATLHALHLD